MGAGRRRVRSPRMAVVIAIDAGTTGVRCLRPRREAATPAGYAYREFPQHFPAPGWVEHDPAEIWAAVTRHAGRADGPPRRRAGRGGGHHQPARDHRGVGPAHGPAPAPRHRLAGPAHRRPLRRAARARATSTWCGARPAWCSTRTSRPPSWSGCSTEGGVAADARPGLRHGRQLGAVEPDRRRGGVHATEPSNASRTMLYDIGALAWSDELLRPVRRAGVVPARGAPTRAGASARWRPALPAARRHAGLRASPATSRRRCSARPASSRACRRTPTAPAASCS